MSALIDDMQSGRISHPDGSLDCDALNDRIKALHAEVADEDSRVELIRLHDALMRTSDSRLIEQGRDPGPLREEWRRTHLAFILAESLTDGEVDEAKLARVNAREVAAGRLHPDETVRIQRVDPDPAPAQAEAGLIRKAARGFSRLFGGAAAAAPAEAPRPGPAEPSAADLAAGAALERAYRAILLWEDEKMRPRLDALIEDFRARLRGLDPAEDPRAAAEREALELGRWYEENHTGLIGEAVSYLGDGVLQDLKAAGADSDFGRVIWDTVGEFRGELARRMAEVREEVLGDAGAAEGSPSGRDT